MMKINVNRQEISVKQATTLGSIYGRWLFDTEFHLTDLEIKHLRNYMAESNSSWYKPEEQPWEKEQPDDNN